MAAAAAAGLKKHGGLDTALIYSEREASAAGVFTTNKVKAAPVLVTKESLKGGRARAIIVNAGNANACTGVEGLENAMLTARQTGKALGVDPSEVMVASTGVIGQQIRMDLLLTVIPELVKNLSKDALLNVATAIMTTDSFPKIAMREARAGGKTYRITGVAKGAGMIMPNMATMLCFILSDINLEARFLADTLKASTEKTFNRITVDGDTSTNDTVLLLANGAAGNGPPGEKERNVFFDHLEQVMDELATMVVRDGEGATKLVTVELKGAKDPSDARKAVRTVSNSSLVKTAFYGQDPNWGRIMAALGRSEISMKENKVDIWIDEIQIVEGGIGKGPDAERDATEKMHKREFTVTIDLHQGDYSDRILTSDLTHEYVSINANYRT